MSLCRLLCALLAGTLIAGAAPALAEMRQAELGELSRLGRVVFRLRSASDRCQERLGPDGISLRLTCPTPADDLDQRVLKVLRRGKVKASIEEIRRGVAMEFVLPSPLAGYRLVQRRGRVQLDVGVRTAESELRHLAPELRLPVSDAGDGELANGLDGHFQRHELAQADQFLRQVLGRDKAEIFDLRRADLARLKGNAGDALGRYLATARRYRRRPGGQLASVRALELALLLKRSLPGRRDPLTLLPPLGPAPGRALALAWVEAARVREWQGEPAEAATLAGKLLAVPTEPVVQKRARAVRDRAVARLLLDAARRGDHQQVASIALAHEQVFLSHPANDLLAPAAYRSLMKMELPDVAARQLQAAVGRTDSDHFLLDVAPLLARAFIRAGKHYRASQVVDYALAVGSGGDGEKAELWQLKGALRLAVGQGAQAIPWLSKMAQAGPDFRLALAESALHQRKSAAYLAYYERLAQELAQGPYQTQAELLRAEALHQAQSPQATDQLRRVLTYVKPSPRVARLRFLLGESFEEQGRWQEAAGAYGAVAGDRRWKRLGGVAGMAASMWAKIRPADQAAAGRARKARRRRRRAARKGKTSPAGGASSDDSAQAKSAPSARKGTGSDGEATKGPAGEEPPPDAAKTSAPSETSEPSKTSEPATTSAPAKTGRQGPTKAAEEGES
jgi:tetratricopeptide (TPR) repeat protein